MDYGLRSDNPTSAPGGYSLSASFAGDPTSAASNTSRAFTISKLGTSLTRAVASPTIVRGADSGVTATLNEANGPPLGFRSIFFILGGAASRTTAVIDEFSTASTSNLQYDPTTNRYSYVWKTTKTMAGMCYRLELGLIDGNTVPVANFQFK